MNVVVAAVNPAAAAVGDNTGSVRRYVHHPPGYSNLEENPKTTYTNRTTGAAGSSSQGQACSYCGRMFRSRSNLSRHVRDHHTSHDPSAAICPVCGKNCRNRSNVLTHMYRVHHITARQLDAFTHPITLPQQSAISRPSEERSDPQQHFEHMPSQTIAPTSHPSSLPSNQSRNLAVHTHNPQSYSSNHQQQQPQQQDHQQQQQQNQIMSYGYSIQDSSNQHHAHHHHLQDNT